MIMCAGASARQRRPPRQESGSGWPVLPDLPASFSRVLCLLGIPRQRTHPTITVALLVVLSSLRAAHINTNRQTELACSVGPAPFPVVAIGQWTVLYGKSCWRGKRS